MTHKFCIDCIFIHVPNHGSLEFAKCKHPDLTHTSPVDGSIAMEYCTWQRAKKKDYERPKEYKARCGVEGVSWREAVLDDNNIWKYSKAATVVPESSVKIYAEMLREAIEAKKDTT